MIKPISRLTGFRQNIGNITRRITSRFKPSTTTRTVKRFGKYKKIGLVTDRINIDYDDSEFLNRDIFSDVILDYPDFFLTNQMQNISEPFKVYTHHADKFVKIPKTLNTSTKPLFEEYCKKHPNYFKLFNYFINRKRQNIALLGILDLLKKYVAKQLSTPQSSKINNTIIPYCGEVNKFIHTDSIEGGDQVNDNLMYISDLETINDKLNMYNSMDEFNSKSDKGKFNSKEAYPTPGNIFGRRTYKTKEDIISSIHHPFKFLKHILMPMRQLTRISEKPKHMFIISHSKFMTNFVTMIYNLNKFYTMVRPPWRPSPRRLDVMKEHLIKNLFNIIDLDKEYEFNNLDIIHLIIEISGVIKHVGLYRYNRNSHSYDYKIDNYDKEVYPNNNDQHIFIMRHCGACHNYKHGSWSTIRYKGVYYDSSKYSSCFPTDIDDIMSAGSTYVELLRNFINFTSLNDIQFGSSVIFRAIITSYILQKSIEKELNAPSIASEDAIKPTFIAGRKKSNKRKKSKKYKKKSNKKRKYKKNKLYKKL